MNFVPETTKRHIKTLGIFQNGWNRCYHPLSTKRAGIDVFLFRNWKRTMLSFLNSVQGFHFEDGAGRLVSNRSSFFHFNSISFFITTSIYGLVTLVLFILKWPPNIKHYNRSHSCCKNCSLPRNYIYYFLCTIYF